MKYLFFFEILLVMNNMPLDHKQAIFKSIQVLNKFILEKKYSRRADNSCIRLINPAGEEIEILTIEDAENYKNLMETVLSMEKTFSR